MYNFTKGVSTFTSITKQAQRTVYELCPMLFYTKPLSCKKQVGRRLACSLVRFNHTCPFCSSLFLSTPTMGYALVDRRSLYTCILISFGGGLRSRVRDGEGVLMYKFYQYTCWNIHFIFINVSNHTSIVRRSCTENEYTCCILHVVYIFT